jgi:hypothetical protein
MDNPITIRGNDMVFVPGLMRWCMGCDKRTFNEDTRDAAARMFALAGFIPNITAGQLRDLATGKTTWVVDEEENTLTLLPVQEEE